MANVGPRLREPDLRSWVTHGTTELCLYTLFTFYCLCSGYKVVDNGKWSKMVENGGIKQRKKMGFVRLFFFIIPSFISLFSSKASAFVWIYFFFLFSLPTQLLELVDPGKPEQKKRRRQNHKD